MDPEPKVLTKAFYLFDWRGQPVNAFALLLIILGIIFSLYTLKFDFRSGVQLLIFFGIVLILLMLFWKRRGLMIFLIGLVAYLHQIHLLDSTREQINIGVIWFLVLVSLSVLLENMRYVIMWSVLVAFAILFTAVRAYDGNPLWANETTVPNLLGMLAVITTSCCYSIKFQKDKQVQLREALKEAEALAVDLRQTNNKLQASERLKTRLLTTMNHELRTPMMAMQTATDSLQRGSLSDGVKRNADVMSRSAVNAIHVLNDVVLLGEMSTGKKMQIERSFNLFEMVEGICDIVQFSSLHNSRGLLDFSPHMSADYQGDEVRLRQVLLNIIRNAYNHSGSELIHIRARQVGNHTLRFDIRDWGIGIKREDAEKIFEPYTQISSKERGSGLGLSIAKEFISDMGGRISVDTDLPEGVNFTVEAPCKSGGMQVMGDIIPAPKRDSIRIEADEIVLKVMRPWFEYWGIREDPDVAEGISLAAHSRQLRALSPALLSELLQ